MIQRPWKPDGGKDLSGIWTKRGRKNRQATEKRTIAKPNGMMFYHIPIEETYSTPDVDVKSGKPLDVGEQMEKKEYPKTNGRMFEDGLMKAHENELGGREVKVVANGHCHGMLTYLPAPYAVAYGPSYSNGQMPARDGHLVLLQRWIIVLRVRQSGVRS
jgi:hypothetical protein